MSLALALWKKYWPWPRKPSPWQQGQILGRNLQFCYSDDYRLVGLQPAPVEGG